ncbi:MAG: hypothetical protein NW226_11280 [Microscillaceae bacterium]|nr:hypothetical protein [Microscillaceae bacterium]
MKKILVLCFILTFFSQSGQACDICGCRLGGIYFGILPGFNYHFVGLRYSHATFNASLKYNSEYNQDEFSEDTYQRYDLLGRYSIHAKLQISFMVPYLVNQMNGSHQNVRSTGLGDPMLLLYYTPFNTSDQVQKDWKHSLMIGGGLKFPLGEFKKEDQGELINRNFQLGSGSLDYLLSLNYTLRYKNLGLNVESSYKLNSRNNENYLFGNQMNTSGYLIYWFEKPQISFLPYLGAYYERAGMHQDGKIDQVNTGGSALFGSVGLQSFYNNLNINILYQHPIAQNFNVEEIAHIETGARFTVGMLYTFTFKKKKKTESH